MQLECHLVSWGDLGLRLDDSVMFTEFLEPFQRVIQPEEMWLYKNPLVQSDLMPTRIMFAISFLTPLAVIFVVKIIRRTDRTDIREACLAVSLALALNGVFTNTIKLIAGRRVCPSVSYFSDSHCRLSVCLPLFMDTRVPNPLFCFAVAFSGLGFTSFYLAGKLQCFTDSGRGKGWRLCAVVLPLYCAMMIALSRTCDYKHHWQDSLVGGLVGLVFAYICYRQHYPSFLCTVCHLPYESLGLPATSMEEEPPAADNATSLPLEGLTEGPV
uniref:Phospholipid phosphatase 4 n=1 Tax=Erpetoichthys calabaricus TaxID=27687 RepID=A0A8C4SX38_ERPCA